MLWGGGGHFQNLDCLEEPIFRKGSVAKLEIFLLSRVSMRTDAQRFRCF